MKNKILISVIIPFIDESFELYIPTNESIGKVVELIVKSIFGDEIAKSGKYNLIDPDLCTLYPKNQIIRDTNIKNSKKLILSD